MSIDRSWSDEYLREQHKAIRWLYEQGITPEEIRELRWGRVDELDKTFSVNTEVIILNFDRKTGLCRRDSYNKEFKVPLRDTECEQFFLKSKIYCAWMFTREKPTTWRREGSKKSLYSLSVIRDICGKLGTPISTINALTNEDIFANIEVSKANVTKMKTKELEGEAIVA